ncbi:peptidase family C78-domain-containing protein [Melampsora americana]|nr:peptidase family C78-domain-containing protein [Melampsora americana]
MNPFDQPIPYCPVCNQPWDETTDKEAHVSACLGEDHIPPSAPHHPSDTSDEIEILTPSNTTKPKQNARIKPINKSQVDGVANLLIHIEKLLAQSITAGRIRSAVVCNPKILYIRTSSSITDRGSTYRQTLSSHPELNSQSRPEAEQSHKRPSTSHNEGEIADIPNIQSWQRIIEEAWKKGFDTPGADSFAHKLIGKRKWIGTTEAYVAFTSLGVRARVIDFPNPTGPKGTHLGLTNWVRAYFNETSVSSNNVANGSASGHASSIINTDKMPLYLQHAGHSRTIVGFETDDQGNENLLIFDPAKAVPAALKSLCGSTPSRSNLFSLKRLKSSNDSPPQPEPILDLSHHSKLLAPFRVSIKSLSRRDQYQILCVDNGPLLSSSELESRKVIHSTRIE